MVRADVDMPWLRADAEVARAASANHAFVGRSAWLGDWVPDIVHAHDWHVGWAAEVLATVFDVPLVTTLHGTERGRHGGHLPVGEPTDINAVEWWLAFRSSRVITSTRLMVREITGGFELDPDVVRRIPNGIDPSWWRIGAGDDAVGTGDRGIDDHRPGRRAPPRRRPGRSCSPGGGCNTRRASRSSPGRWHRCAPVSPASSA